MDQFAIGFLIYTFGIVVISGMISFAIGRAALRHEAYDDAYQDVCKGTREFDVIEGHAEEAAEFLEWLADEIDAGQLCNSDTVSFSRDTRQIAAECLLLSDHLIKSGFGRHKPGFLTRIAQRAGTAPYAHEPLGHRITLDWPPQETK